MYINKVTTRAAIASYYYIVWNCVNTCVLLDTHDIYARELATELRSLVVSVDYRLAPEHRHSMPLDDCFVALRYLMRNADRWKVNPARVAVAGAPTSDSLSQQ